jgi:hypothetical protein
MKSKAMDPVTISKLLYSYNSIILLIIAISLVMCPKPIGLEKKRIILYYLLYTLKKTYEYNGED